MTIISYAQNFEDVILWRALGHVERGFYIDIGAQDPMIDSVSLAFYERGWRGVHVEPNRAYAEKLRLARPDEEVIETVIGRDEEVMDFFEIAGTGLSTGDKEIAQKYKCEGRAVELVRIRCRPLSAILEAYRDREIHWLKIDTEGMEETIIDGWPPARARPWIVVVESTQPNSRELNHHSWEYKLLALGYVFAYFDGLNRYYVSHQHPELMKSFGPGPNIFDDFILSSTAFCQRGRPPEDHRSGAIPEASAPEPSDAHATSSTGRRILVDLSTSFQWRGKNAVGIVRTERETAARLIKDKNLTVLPVIFSEGHFCAIGAAEALDLLHVTEPAAPKDPAKFASPNHEPLSLAVRLRNALGRFTRGVALSFVKVLPTRARDDAKASLINAYHAMRKIAYRPDPPIASNHVAISDVAISDSAMDFNFVVHPDQSDVLFIGGLGWDVIDCRRLGILKARSGMKIATIIFDLIPTKMPHFLGGRPKDFYLNYFLHMIDLCDHIFCISKATQSDLLDLCAFEKRECPPTSVIYLGANLPAAPRNVTSTDQHIIERLKDRKFALSVGTFEVRKNYGFLLSLWEKLVAEPSFDLDLVIAGMPGWGTEEVVKRLEGSPLFEKRVFWLKGLSDGGLSWLYSNCHVFVFPSLYEGWGLPVVEALQHGKPVVASNRGSIPEAGLGVARIIDPDDLELWAAEIRRHSALLEPEKVPAVVIPSWDQTTLEIKSTLMEMP